MKRTAKKARDIFQETRESTGAGPTLQAQLKDEDKIFSRRIFTATKQTNQTLTGVMEEGVSHMEEVMKAILKLSNIDAHKQRMAKLEQRAKKWHDKANVF